MRVRAVVFRGGLREAAQLGGALVPGRGLRAPAGLRGARASRRAVLSLARTGGEGRGEEGVWFVAPTLRGAWPAVPKAIVGTKTHFAVFFEIYKIDTFLRH